jgi:hypothetical protein
MAEAIVILAVQAPQPDPLFISLQKGSQRKYNEHREIYWRGRSASSTATLKTILTRDQLEQCANEYVNNGVLARCVDTSVTMINPKFTGFEIVANDERLEGATEQEIAKINKDLASTKIRKWRQRTINANKRCHLWENTNKLLTNALLFGRNILGIERFTVEKDWPIYGKPLALKPLNSLRISEVKMNEQTYQFEGIRYDLGRFRGIKTFKAIDLIPAFYSDNNVIDNTNYSGTSAAWRILSAAQSIDVALDEDIPESLRQVWAKFGIIFSGTSKKAIVKEMKKELEASTWFMHNQPNLKAEVFDLKSSLIELPNTIVELAKYICLSMSLPLFLLFEETATFATADQVLQVFKKGMLEKYRTWLQDMLETYWYDPMLADFLGIPVEEVIDSDWKIKVTFPDLDFSTRTQIVNADKTLFDMGVMTPIDVADDINRKDIASRLRKEELDSKLQEANDIIEAQRNEIDRLRNGNVNQDAIEQIVNNNGSSEDSSATNKEDQPDSTN